ncbi:hypothetical protein RRG08_001444 [Elysia crispata]|uniref:Integrase catalytic domain-containing protein n=1 Tax=Elysia crispata TaxID=231223 RepID=A0AAE1DL14_9GAST|nr:hypothetical protein RRG08_001444 [Elysia crispata]
MKTTTAEKTTDVLRQIFAIHGLPTTLVSGNGPPFTSSEFGNFLTTNRIKHITSKPYQPSTNGSAEILVQTFKQMLKAANPGQTGPQKLARILLQFRTTPHAMTGKSPAELLFKRKLKIRLNLIMPGFTTDMRNKQERQMQTQKSLRSFQPGDKMQAAPSSSSEDDQLAEDEILPAEMLGSPVQNASPESPQNASPESTQRDATQCPTKNYGRYPKRIRRPVERMDL